MKYHYVLQKQQQNINFIFLPKQPLGRLAAWREICPTSCKRPLLVVLGFGHDKPLSWQSHSKWKAPDGNEYPRVRKPKSRCRLSEGTNEILVAKLLDKNNCNCYMVASKKFIASKKSWHLLQLGCCIFKIFWLIFLLYRECYIGLQFL